MKFLFVLEHFHPYIGGAEELFLGLTTSLASNGHEVNVVTTLYSKSIPGNEVYKGVNIHRVNCYNRFFFTFLSLPAIIRFAKKTDLIHTASYNAAVPSYIAGKICRKKVFITFHEVWGKLWMQLPFKSKLLLKAYQFYEKLILSLSFNKYIAISEATFNELKNAGIPPNKIKLIYNGLDYMKFNDFIYSPPVNFTYCYFGRLGISKGIDILIEAFNKTVHIIPNVKLKLIIPTYPEDLYKKVISLIKESGNQDKIILLHDLSKIDLFNEISNTSCVIIPSYSEGFCFTAAEACALGVPVISSGKGSLKEVVGGKHIHLDKLSSDDLQNAMIKAYTGEWDFSPQKSFHLADSVNNYLQLLENELLLLKVQKDF